MALDNDSTDVSHHVFLLCWWLDALIVRLMRRFLPTIPLRRDPATDVVGTVDDFNSRGFGACEKAHRGSIDERDIAQVEDDTTRFVCKELLQPSRMLDVHVSTQGEHDRVRCCQAMDSVRQPLLHCPPKRASGAPKRPVPFIFQVA